MDLLARRMMMQPKGGGIRFVEWIARDENTVGYSPIIDTGLFWITDADKIEIKAALTKDGVGALYGNSNSGSNSPLNCRYGTTETFLFANKWTSVNTYIQPEINTPYIFIQTPSKAFINGNEFNANSGGTINYHVYLCGYNDAVSNSIYMKIYYCKMWLGDILVRDFSPCINDEGEVGLYDKVTNNFYGNVYSVGGVTPFIAGPAV